MRQDIPYPRHPQRLSFAVAPSLTGLFTAALNRLYARGAIGILSCAMIAAASTLSGCNPPPSQEIRWTYGNQEDDYAVAVRQTADGGYLIVGETDPSYPEPTDIVLLKIDASGRQVWVRTFGGESDDFATSLLPMPDGSFAIIGTTSMPTGLPDPNDYESHVLVVSVESSGAIRWEKTFGTESPRAAAVTAEGDLIVGGMSSTRTVDGMYLSKISSDGEQLWMKAVSAEEASLSALRITANGDIVLAGSNYGGERSRGYLAKTDSDGVLRWERSDFDDRVYYFPDLIETSQGDYLALGMSFDLTLSSVLLVKTNTNGDPLWTHAPAADFISQYPGIISSYSLVEAGDGGYVMAGGYDQGIFSRGFEEPFAGMYLLKTDTDGRESWSHIYTRRDRAPVANFVDITADGGYIIAGYDGGVLDETGVGRENSDMAIVKTDANGIIEQTD